MVVAAAHSHQHHPNKATTTTNNNGSNAGHKQIRTAKTRGGEERGIRCFVGAPQHSAIPMGDARAGQSSSRPRRGMMLMRRMMAEKPRQEICAPLKWTCFMANFVMFLASVGCLALGLYLFSNDPRPVSEVADFFLNPSVPIASIGLLSGIVTLMGMFGALRDNVVLLKLFAFCVFFAYALLVICTCLLFLIFYSDANADATGISAQSILIHLIARYQTNKNIADFMDYLQEQLECCGSTSFRDWHLSEQFACNSTNPYPERCGVPFSCCRRSVVSGNAGGGSTGASQKPLAPAIRSIQCWQNVQKKREQELDQDIHVAGCLLPLRALFDAHALHIGMAVLSVILPVCFGVCLSQCLARQIDYQHFLLRREQRRIERRERRERRYREQAETKEAAARKKHSVSSHTELMERGEMPTRTTTTATTAPPKTGTTASAETRPCPPQMPLPPTPRGDAEEEAAILRAVLKASKREYEEQQQRCCNNNNRQIQHQRRGSSNPPPNPRATSFSPMRGKAGAVNNGGKKMTAAAAAENKHSSKQRRRKSMTLDIEAAAGRRDGVDAERNCGGAIKKKAPIKGEGNKSNGADQKQAKQRNTTTTKAAATNPTTTTATANGQRSVPSAPPISVILQQHHFN